MKTTNCLGKASSASLSPMVINAFGCKMLRVPVSCGYEPISWCLIDNLKTATACDTCLIGY
ncbi:hypothetical protein MED222_05000 [Vibrio sp. MED222]|nr:hypothetical protein MED222_05000 [Vibrio sp. MED222]